MVDIKVHYDLTEALTGEDGELELPSVCAFLVVCREELTEPRKQKPGESKRGGQKYCLTYAPFTILPDQLSRFKGLLLELFKVEAVCLLREMKSVGCTHVDEYMSDGLAQMMLDAYSGQKP